MGAREETEDVLRQIHVLFAKAEPYENSKRKVVIDKNDLMELLKKLNDCMYSMMDEYELTESSREKANRDQKKKGDDIIFDARKEADDIYAAAMMYTDQALRRIQDSMKDAGDRLEKLMADTKEAMDTQKAQVHSDQLEARAGLQDLIDSDKYMRLIQDENLRLEKEKEQQSLKGAAKKEEEFRPVEPEIRINTAYLEKTGMSVPGDEDEAKTGKQEEQPEGNDGDIDLPEVQLPPDLQRDLHLDAEGNRQEETPADRDLRPLNEEKSSVNVHPDRENRKKEKEDRKSFRIGSIFNKD